MSTFSERLGQLIGGNRQISAFARDCGLSHSLVRQYLSGSNPGLDKVVQIACAKKVRVEWLATGEGPQENQVGGFSSSATANIELDFQENNHFSVDSSLLCGIKIIPMLTSEFLIDNYNNRTARDSNGCIALSERYLMQLGIRSRDVCALQVLGRSMAPTINDKDIVIIDSSVRRATFDGIYTIAYGEMFAVKRIRMLLDGGMKIIDDNKTEGYEDEIVHKTEIGSIKIVGQIKGHIRSF